MGNYPANLHIPLSLSLAIPGGQKVSLSWYVGDYPTSAAEAPKLDPPLERNRKKKLGNFLGSGPSRPLSPGAAGKVVTSLRPPGPRRIDS